MMPASAPRNALRQMPGASRRTGPSLTVELGPDVAPVRRVVAAMARRFNQICVTMVADSVAPAELTPLQFAVLAYLNKRDGQPGIDQNSLAARLGVERSHVSLLVEELGTRDLVERRVNGADRRARVLALTPRGEKLYDRLRTDNVAANDRILDVLTQRERELFLNMLVRLIQRNGAHARPGAGRRKRGSRQLPTEENR
jgi:DNA-binding MarR family transcriptional regulator